MTIDLARLNQVVKDVYSRYSTLAGGENASYIPYLASVPSQLAAVAIVTVDGDIISQGDADFRFALESISKVCSLALALEDIGPQAVQDKIGADPTGLPFNSVMALELHNGKPLSPLVNAGAMSTVSAIKASSREERWARILDIQQQLAGAPIALSDEVNHSEQTTNFTTGPLPGYFTRLRPCIAIPWRPVTSIPGSAQHYSIPLNWQRWGQPLRQGASIL